jgi:hypothetical protein
MSNTLFLCMKLKILFCAPVVLLLFIPWLIIGKRQNQADFAAGGASTAFISGRFNFKGITNKAAFGK